MNLSTAVEESGVAVIDSHFSFQRFVELHFGAGEAEAFGLGRDLEAAAVPLHDIVVADRAFVNEAADAFQIPGSGAPGFFGLAWCAAEAPVVVGKEAAENFVGRWEIARASQPQFAGEAILKGAPEAFDAAFGLRRAGGDVGDAELLERTAELSRLAFARELFFDGPVIVVADENAVAIAVKAEGDAAAAQQAAEQAKIAARIFGGKKFGGQDLASGVVEKAEQGELRTALFEPGVQAGIEEQHVAFASARQASLAMRGSATLTRRADPGRAQQTAESLAAQRQAFDLAELFAEMVIVKTGIARAGQMQDAGAQACG